MFHPEIAGGWALTALVLSTLGVGLWAVLRTAFTPPRRRTRTRVAINRLVGGQR